MAALAHTLFGSPARCGLCRAINPKEDFKLCAWSGLAREINASGISISRAYKRKNGNLTGRWKLNAVHNHLTIHNASAPTTVEIPVTCYQVIPSLFPFSLLPFVAFLIRMLVYPSSQLSC